MQASVMGRSLAKTLRKMSHCPKYSPQPVFPEVTAAIADIRSQFWMSQLWMLPSGSSSDNVAESEVLDNNNL